jgi:hypothetical protein
MVEGESVGGHGELRRVRQRRSCVVRSYVRLVEIEQMLAWSR